MIFLRFRDILFTFIDICTNWLKCLIQHVLIKEYHRKLISFGCTSFCGVAYECPGASVYDPCASACPMTCSDLSSAFNCTLPCIETCRCPDSMVLDGTECVDPEECGCTLDNNVYLSVSVLGISVQNLRFEEMHFFINAWFCYKYKLPF